MKLICIVRTMGQYALYLWMLIQNIILFRFFSLCYADDGKKQWKGKVLVSNMFLLQHFIGDFHIFNKMKKI